MHAKIYRYTKIFKIKILLHAKVIYLRENCKCWNFLIRYLTKFRVFWRAIMHIQIYLSSQDLTKKIPLFPPLTILHVGNFAIKILNYPVLDWDLQAYKRLG